MSDHLFDEQFQRELDMAGVARTSGNEGRARVCARRAAGLVASEYFARNGMAAIKPSAYDRLRELRNLAEIPDEIRQVIDHFLLRVNLDQQLPIPVDLIEDAHWLKDQLLDRS